MNQKQTAAPASPGVGLGDIYYIVFRRKWLILCASVLGFVAAGITSALWPRTYSSTAKLYIAYIADSKGPDEETPSVKVTPTTSAGNPLTSEVEILTSLDNLRAAAEALTPARILAKYGGGSNANLDQAAGMIQGNLSVDSPPHSQIIWVTFSSRSGEIVKAVLDQVITNYINKHLLIHQPANDEWVTREDSLREQDLKATENQLAELKSQAGIVNLKEEESAYKAQEGSVKREYYMALADLAEATARLEQLRKFLPATNQVATSNAAAPGILQPSELTMSDYKQARQELMDLQAKEANYESRYSTNVPLVQANLAELQNAKAKVRRLEEANPGLLAVAKEEARIPGAPAVLDPVAAYNSEVTRIAGYMAKTNEFAKELQQFQGRGTNLNHLEVMIEDLERVKAVQEDYLKRVSGQMYAVKIEGTIGDYRGSNIKVIQNPSPPSADLKKSDRVIFAIAAGGVLLGIGLAFLWELYLD
ncbi:MAG: Wzz/FepE/Etk N-terminal domain-containing protein, partial [Verrucomicrobiota bacterium]